MKTSIEVNGARIATHWESAAYDYDAAVWPTFKDCRLRDQARTSEAVPTGLCTRPKRGLCSAGPGIRWRESAVETASHKSFEGLRYADGEPASGTGGRDHTTKERHMLSVGRKWAMVFGVSGLLISVSPFLPMSITSAFILHAAEPID